MARTATSTLKHLKFFNLTILLVVGISACAKKPEEKVAAGQDHHLFTKADFLQKTISLSTAPAILKDFITHLPKNLQREKASFALSKSYLTLFRHAGKTKQPVIQYAISGHYDLVPQKNIDGEESQYLVKDQSENENWKDRLYFATDPADPLLIEATEQTLRYLYATTSVQDNTYRFLEDQIPGLTEDQIESLQQDHKLQTGDILRGTLSQSFFTLFIATNQRLIAQTKINYFDLVQEKNRTQELTPNLVRDQTQRWDQRKYVEISPDQTTLQKFSHDFMLHLYPKEELVSKTFQLVGAPPTLITETFAMKDRFNLVALAESTDQAEYEFVVTEQFLTLYKIEDDRQQFVLQYPIQGHYDVLDEKTAEGESTTGYQKTTDKPWQDRQFVQIDPKSVLLPEKSSYLKTNAHQIFQQADLDGTFVLNDLPFIKIKEALQAANKELGANAAVTFKRYQTQLLVYVDGRLILTYNILSHFDLLQQKSPDQKDTFHTQVASSDGDIPWDSRAYLEIQSEKPQYFESQVKANALKKDAFQGEYIYVATVVESHSENGIFFPGQNLQSDSRLTFKFSDDYLTAYKTRELLNDSQAASPVLRYPAEHFDITQLTNSFGDPTHLEIEERKAAPANRAYTRISFANNLIQSYFNDLMGLEKLYFGRVIVEGSKLVGEIKIEENMITFETETVLVPNVKGGFSGISETLYEPTAVKIKHAFLNVKGRTYQPKPYDNNDFARFGFFRTTELGLDPIKGKTDSTIKHFLQGFDISGDKKIIYYLNQEFPEQYRQEIAGVFAAWNKAFEAAVGRKILELRPNSGQHFSDPRYNMIAYIPNYMLASPLGYGPSIVDPETGERLAGKVFVYGDSHLKSVNFAMEYYDMVTQQKTAETYAAEQSFPNSTAAKNAKMTHLLAQNTPHKLQAHQYGSGGKSMAAAASALQKLNDHADFAQAASQQDLSTFMQQFNPASLNKEHAQNHAIMDRYHTCQIKTDHHVLSALKFIDAHKALSRPEIQTTLDSKGMMNTLLHELGHNLGLRHNFQGSWDEKNFPAAYHKLKASQKTTTFEWQGKYATSSVMDYTDTFEALSDDIGPYDLAAIKYAYGDILESTEALVTGATASPAKPIAKQVFTSKVREILQNNATISQQQAIELANRQLKIKPYLFCTDSDTEEDPTCNRFDMGVTVAELAKNLTLSYEYEYGLFGFRRGRRRFTGGSDYVINRYFMPMRQFFDEFLYRTLTGKFNTLPDSSPESRADYLSAVQTGISFFIATLNTLEPGSYTLDAATNEFKSGSSNSPDAKQLKLTLADGKYLLPGFEQDGLHQRPTRRGVEIDKIASLLMFTMRGYPAQKYQQISLTMNYFDLLKKPLLEIFSKLMRSQSNTEIQVTKTADGTFKMGTSDDPNAENLTAMIKPSTSALLQKYAMVTALLFVDNSSDKTFKDYIDFRIKGDNDQSIPATVETVEFTSQLGTRVYVIPQTSDKMSIAFAMAQDAPALEQQLQAQQKQKDELPPQIIQQIKALLLQAEVAPEAKIDAYLEQISADFEENIDQAMQLIEKITPSLTPELISLAAKLRIDVAAYKAIDVTELTQKLKTIEADLLELQEFAQQYN